MPEHITNVVLLQQLVDITNEIREQREQIKTTTTRRNQLLLQAHQENMNITQIIRSTGLSRQSVYTILHKQEGFSPRPAVRIDPLRPVYPGQDTTMNMDPKNHKLVRGM